MRRVSRSLLLVALVASVSYSVRSEAQFEREHHPGAVFVMNNSATWNEVISFTRATDGSLQQTGTFATGGRGTGGVTDPLESQGSLSLSSGDSCLNLPTSSATVIAMYRTPVTPSNAVTMRAIPVSGTISPYPTVDSVIKLK